MRKERGGQWPEPMAIGAGRDTPSVGLPSGRDSPPPRHQGTSISSSWTSCWHHYWHCHHHCHRHCHHGACRPLLPAPLGAAGGEGRACEPAFLWRSHTLNGEISANNSRSGINYLFIFLFQWSKTFLPSVGCLCVCGVFTSKPSDLATLPRERAVLKETYKK